MQQREDSPDPKDWRNSSSETSYAAKSSSEAPDKTDILGYGEHRNTADSASTWLRVTLAVGTELLHAPDSTAGTAAFQKGLLLG